MGAIDFRTVDLNLLAPLRVLLVERHVTRSAEKLGISQPAMSASLARLRTLFRDQLLVRGARGLALTPRAEQLLEQLDHVMAVIGEMSPCRWSLRRKPASGRSPSMAMTSWSSS